MCLTLLFSYQAYENRNEVMEILRIVLERPLLPVHSIHPSFHSCLTDPYTYTNWSKSYNSLIIMVKHYTWYNFVLFC